MAGQIRPVGGLDGLIEFGERPSAFGEQSGHPIDLAPLEFLQSLELHLGALDCAFGYGSHLMPGLDLHDDEGHEGEQPHGAQKAGQDLGREALTQPVHELPT